MGTATQGFVGQILVEGLWLIGGVGLLLIFLGNGGALICLISSQNYSAVKCRLIMCRSCDYVCIPRQAM